MSCVCWSKSSSTPSCLEMISTISTVLLLIMMDDVLTAAMEFHSKSMKRCIRHVMKESHFELADACVFLALESAYYYKVDDGAKPSDSPSK